MRFADWKSVRVQVGPVNLHYRTAGTGPVVVLLHGFPQHSLMWHAIGPVLAERFTVIAPDQRGVGMSTITADGYDGTTMAADLKGLLDAVGVEKAFVVGYDLGARVAAAFARDFPERAERVAFVEFALPGFGYEQSMAPTNTTAPVPLVDSVGTGQLGVWRDSPSPGGFAPAATPTSG